MTAFLRRTYAGGGTTTALANAMAATDTTFAIVASTGWPGSPGTSGFIVVIDRGTASEEKILCSSNSGTTVTVASSGRGYDGTTATTHNANATVSLCGGAIDFDEANQITNLLGNAATGAVLLGAGTGTLPTELDVGSAGQVLGVASGSPAWQDGYIVEMFAHDDVAAGTFPTNGQCLFTAGVQTVTFSTGDGTLTFPTEFPNGLLTVVASVGQNSAYGLVVVSTTKSAVGLVLFDTASGTGIDGGVNIPYIAIGF